MGNWISMIFSLVSQFFLWHLNFFFGTSANCADYERLACPCRYSLTTSQPCHTSDTKNEYNFDLSEESNQVVSHYHFVTRHKLVFCTWGLGKKKIRKLCKKYGEYIFKGMCVRICVPFFQKHKFLNCKIVIPYGSKKFCTREVAAIWDSYSICTPSSKTIQIRTIRLRNVRFYKNNKCWENTKYRNNRLRKRSYPTT